MPRICTVCTHPEREAIDRALIAEEPYRHIASRFDTSTAALQRHKAEHLPGALVQAEEAREVVASVQLMNELQRCFQRVNLLFDACDRWLRDAEDPERYEVGPRAEDVKVTYTIPDPDGATIRRKRKLSELLAEIEGTGKMVELVEAKHADPRELVLKTAARLQAQLELLAKLMGQLKPEGVTVNVLVSPEWQQLRALILQALDPHPAARLAVAAALMQAEAHARN